jgi:hypothetical protein
MNVILCNIMSYCIYKIVCDDLPEYIYVGSTKAFRQRKSQHKNCYNNGNTEKLYTTIRENGGWDNWRMVMIEECGEISFTEARIREEENRMKLEANMNMRKCYSTEEEKKEERKEYRQEYREANKEKVREYDKEYKKTNKEKMKEYNKQWNEANKEKMKEYNKQYNKQYREANKEHLKEIDKQYREANKEKINERYKQKITCECGRIFALGDKARHLKTNVHTNFINNKII